MARTKGAAQLSDDKRARILAKKNVHLSTQSRIAEEEGVSRNTVVDIRSDVVSPKVREMAEVYERNFITYALANALKAQQQTFEKLDELSADKAAVVAEKNFKMLQAYQSRPVQTSQVSELNIARELFRRFIERRGFTPEEAMAGVMMEFPNIRPDEIKLFGEGST